MAAKTVDLDTYSHLLSETHPQVPHTATENEKLIALLQELQSRDPISPEEHELMELLLVLIENFENTHYSTAKSKPDATLRELMRARGTKPKDLYAIFGSKGTTSEVIRGKRAVSKSAAKALAQWFGVSADLFL